MLTAHTVGNKYAEVKDLRVKEIAKLIRQDLKKFKGCKFSVKSTYNSINVKLINCDDVKKYFYIWEGVNQKDPRYIDTFHKEVKSIMNQYNFDNGDSMSDYWHKNFFAFFDLDYPLLKKARVELGLIKDE
tara:strand:+ start:233 stop:622 length:390 start_codon:yes stop_codon:yes gene_type:complete